MKLKFVTFSTLLFLTFNQLFGQYIPMVEEGKFWIYNKQSNQDFPSSESGHAITFLGDTTINSINYKKVFRLDLKGHNSCQPPSLPCWNYDYPYQTIEKKLISFIREDTTNKKVYNLPISGNFENLSYDFSLAVGDTLNQSIYNFIGADQMGIDGWGIVDSFGVVEKYGKERTTIYSYGVIYWHGLPIVGAARIFQGFGIEHYGVFYEPLTLLQDFCEGEIEPCHLILSDASIERKNEVTIFPNPSKGIFQISIEEENVNLIRVYSLIGQIKTEFQHMNKIDLSEFASGIYFLEIITMDNKRLIKKILKEN